jgi:outer membrane protein TolC
MLYQNVIVMAVSLAVVLLAPAHAHPGEVEPILTVRQLERRQAAINARHAAVRNCDGAIAAFEAQRRAKRSALAALYPRSKHGVTSTHNRRPSVTASCSETSTATSTTTSTANVPTYTTLQNVDVSLTVASLPYSLVVL